MKREAVSRRALLAASILPAACGRLADPYFGRTTPPDRQRLCYLLGSEPASLDPAFYAGGFEGYVIPALFETLTNYHPQSLEPLAALATHIEVAGSQLTLYLRGHERPRGWRLPNTDTLRVEHEEGKLKQDFARGHTAPPDSIPALWSDGHPVTAHDFVYAWRRLVNPKTGAPLAERLLGVQGAEAILSGKLDPDRLSVTALGDFALQVELRIPPSLFLKMAALPMMAAVPRRFIETAKAAWTEPHSIVTNGPFLLKLRRPYDRIVAVRNPRYYEADLVALEEIEFVPVPDGVTAANLYRAGSVHAMPGERLSSLLQHALDGHRDFHVSPAHFVIWHGFNIRKPPFDNVLLRYALNMATGKAEIARCFGGGRLAARNIIPPMEGYPAPQTLPIAIDGTIYDVLSYNPEGARSLLTKAGYPNGMGRDGRPLSFEILFPTLPHSRLIAEMLQQQWRSNLNVEPKLVLREFNVWIENIMALDYAGAAEGGGWPDYLDPNGVFDWFVNGAASSCTGYADPLFDQKMSEANEALEPATRLRRLAKAEEYLLRAMPVIPIFHNVWLYLQKPFVGGLEGNLLDKHPFKYAWIDTGWKPSIGKELK